MKVCQIFQVKTKLFINDLKRAMIGKSVHLYLNIFPQIFLKYYRLFKNTYTMSYKSEIGLQAL